VDQSSADGMNHAKNWKEVKCGVDGRTTTAGQKFGGKQRPDTDHHESAESVENKYLDKRLQSKLQNTKKKKSTLYSSRTHLSAEWWV